MTKSAMAATSLFAGALSLALIAGPAWADCGTDVRDAAARLASAAPSANTDARHMLAARRLLDAAGSQNDTPEGEAYCQSLLESAERDMGEPGKQPLTSIPPLGSGADRGVFGTR